MSRFWSFSRADGGLSSAYHLFSSLSTQNGFFCSSPLLCCKSSWTEREKKQQQQQQKHCSSLLQTNSLNVSTTSPSKSFDKIRKDAVSKVLVCQPWHIGIHSSLMWQGPPTAKPPFLLHRLLITVDKHARGALPPRRRRHPPSSPN